MKSSIRRYRGTRDFYPADYRLQSYLFEAWSRVVESFAFERYDAPILEPLDLYHLKAQTNTEIIQEQIYSFTDRAGRKLALRPEMTPSLGRMIAARQQELHYPLRWYSIPNLWRYERPQRGRLREHWQLNVDIFGIDDHEAELELILVARAILENLGATEKMYAIHLSSRALLEDILKKYLDLDDQVAIKLMPLLDRRQKMSSQDFQTACCQLLQEKEKFFKLEKVLKARQIQDLPVALAGFQSAQDLQQLLTDLQLAGFNNVVLDLCIIRGFDYYTGIVFEIFNQSQNNKRSMFGGGRYDNLLASLGGSELSAAGFGMGDVTMLDFLAEHKILPKTENSFDIYLVLLNEVSYSQTMPVLRDLRCAGLRVLVDNLPGKLSKKVTRALKRKAKHVLFVGSKDLQEGLFNLKYLATAKEDRLSVKQIIECLKRPDSDKV